MVAGRRMVSSVQARTFAMAIGLGGVWERPRLAGCAGRILPMCKQKFGLDLKQAGFDRAGTTKSPQQACQPMNERKLQYGSRINTADEATLEGSIGSNIFESLDDRLIHKAVTRSLAPRSASLILRVDGGRIRDILLGGFVRPPHRH